MSAQERNEPCLKFVSCCYETLWGQPPGHRYGWEPLFPLLYRLFITNDMVTDFTALTGIDLIQKNSLCSILDYCGLTHFCYTCLLFALYNGSVLMMVAFYVDVWLWVYIGNLLIFRPINNLLALLRKRRLMIFRNRKQQNDWTVYYFFSMIREKLLIQVLLPVVEEWICCEK